MSLTGAAAPAAKPAGPFSAWEIGLALRYLKAKRSQGGVALISIISFVGILLAVAVLIIVMSVMNGFRTELIGRILAFDGHVYVSGQAINGPDREALMRRVGDVPGVIRVTPIVESPALIQSASGAGTGGVVRGVNPDMVKSGELKLIAGSASSFGQGEWGGDTVLLGDDLAASLGVGPGDSVTLVTLAGSTAFGTRPVSKTYLVGGLFSVGMSDYDAVYVYMPLQQAQLFFDKEDLFDVLEVKLQDPDQAPALRATVQQAAGPGALAMDWTQRSQAFFEALQIERNVMRLILMLIVAIAAMNIISGLVMLVKNKGRDIAILRTIGASQGAVLRVFFLAGSLVGAAGTLAGLIIGVLFCVFIEPIQRAIEWISGARLFNPEIYLLDAIPARVEWTEVAFVVFWSLLMACLATLPPAFRASRLDPVEALRYE